MSNTFRVVLRHDNSEVLSFDTDRTEWLKATIASCIEPAYLFRYSPGRSTTQEIVFESFSDLISIDVDILDDLPR